MKKYKEIAGDGGSDIVGQVAAQVARLKARMAQVRHKIAVMSGKGGVGKSVVTVNLAAALAQQNYRVGLLDADLNGPSLVRMLGVRNQVLKIGDRGVLPSIGPLGIKIISIALLLPREETPVVWKAPTSQGSFVWRGAMELSTLREFITDTDWGTLDFLLIDLPPGADRLPNMAELLPDLRAIIVTIPPEVAQITVSKSIALAQDSNVPLLGLIENMVGYYCPECGAIGALFPGEAGAPKDWRIPCLGKIPFDPRISFCADRGVPFVLEWGDSPAGQAFIKIARHIQVLAENILRG